MWAQEGKMGKINWGRVVLCGFLTGAVWGVLSAIAFPLVGRDFMAALPGGFRGHIPGSRRRLGLQGVRGVLLHWVLKSDLKNEALTV
jgi:hypothetical protein